MFMYECCACILLLRIRALYNTVRAEPTIEEKGKREAARALLAGGSAAAAAA